jgi:putative serine protease PepD
MSDHATPSEQPQDAQEQPASMDSAPAPAEQPTAPLPPEQPTLPLPEPQDAPAPSAPTPYAAYAPAPPPPPAPAPTPVAAAPQPEAAPGPDATPPYFSAPAAPIAPAAATADAHRSLGLGGAIAIAVLVALIAGGVAGVAGGMLGAQLLQAHNGGAGYVGAPASASSEPVVAAAAAAVPSVVNIEVTGNALGTQSGLPSSHPDIPTGGNGSGVAFKRAPDGGTYILTNNHVVENAESLAVRSPSGKSWTGTVVGRDADSDIAVVKIPGTLPVIRIGRSSTLRVGQTTVAIGSPYGLEHSVTSGVISALGRTLSDVGTSDRSQPLVDTIQTDASINPGNSGGALVDQQGRLIGINAAIYTEGGSSAGIGFAVPVDTAVSVAGQLIEGRKVAHPFIGLVGATLTPSTADQNKLSVRKGALVDSTMKGFGAEKAGLQKGDVVTQVDGVAISSMSELTAEVRRHTVGSTLKLTVIRNGKTLEVEVEVGDRPANVGQSVPSTQTIPGHP